MSDSAKQPERRNRGFSAPAAALLARGEPMVWLTGLGLDIGEADRVCLPVEDTLTMEPWQKRPTAQLLLTMYELDRKTPFFADPRYVLQRIVKRFSELSLKPVSPFELVFYLVDQENLTRRPHPPR